MKYYSRKHFECLKGILSRSLVLFWMSYQRSVRYGILVMSHAFEDAEYSFLYLPNWYYKPVREAHCSSLLELCENKRGWRVVWQIVFIGSLICDRISSVIQCRSRDSIVFRILDGCLHCFQFEIRDNFHIWKYFSNLDDLSFNFRVNWMPSIWLWKEYIF